MNLSESLILLFGIFALIVSSIIAHYYWKEYKRNRIKKAGLPPEHRSILERNVSHYRKMPIALRKQLEELVAVFLNEKEFEGCGGLEIDDEIKVTIAGQACLLLLNRKTDIYPTLYSVLIYPSAYFAKTKRKIAGQVVEDEDIRLGESWCGGSVVIAWDEVKKEMNNLNDGRNVVIHEFAHQLDQLDGKANGAPPLEGRTSYREWAKILSSEFENLKFEVSRGIRDVIDEYGASEPAEFFAVATESFFEKPFDMFERHPDLYAELKAFYCIDPISWQEC